MKNFLKNNEIYFTTVAAVLLSVMAIVISINANKIAKYQSKIDYFEKTPDFYISTQYIRNATTGMADNVQLIVSKLGGKAKNIEINHESFVEFEWLSPTGVQEKKRFLLYGFYNQQQMTGQSEGQIRIINGEDNNSRYVTMVDTLSKKLKMEGCEYVFAEEKTILQIGYVNFLGERITEYYDVSFGDGQLIDEKNELAKLFNSTSDFVKTSQVIDLYRFNKKEIDQLIGIMLKR